MDESLLSIEEAFGDLSDPRSRKPQHDLTEILAVALCAILSGVESWHGIQLWGEAKLDWLRQYLSLENGIPSHDTFGRVFASLDPKQFESCFIRWMSGLCPNLAGEVVAIDGKTVRHSFNGDQRAIHLVAAYGAGLGVVLGQQRTAEKSNEITAIPELLDALMLKGAIVTTDAMGCQRKIARKILDRGADYVLALKGKNKVLLSRVCGALDLVDTHQAACESLGLVSEYCDLDKAHGRIESRRCIATERIPGHPAFEALWPGLKSVAFVEATREVGGVVSAERRYYLSSLPGNARQIAAAVRAHWSIENNLHWCLDVTFNEDQCRVRVKNAAQNFAILRRIAFNLLKRDTSNKHSLKGRRILAAARDDYREKLIGWAPRKS